MSDADPNSAVVQTLAERVAAEIAGADARGGKASAGSLAVNYFSLTFPVDVVVAGGTRRAYVKIPKEDLRGGGGRILPISAADRRMAEDEASSLRVLAAEWQGDDLGVSWVRLCAALPEYNAIVTHRVEAADATTEFRRLDLRRRLGVRRAAERLRSALARLGTALGRFHRRHAHKTTFRAAAELAKLERYIRQIEANPYGTQARAFGTLRDSFPRLEFDAIEVQTLKGIDVRNVLIGAQDRLWLLDPGRMKPACREADLARFLMTYRILYWGSPMFLLGLRPDPVAEAAFLDAYHSTCPPAMPRLLGYFLVKEQLKHWHTAIYSLQLLPWPAAFKRLVAAMYVNPYYRREMATALRTALD